MDPDQRELELRAHVRYLLFDYARAHLTKDYLTFSEDAVSEVRTSFLPRLTWLTLVQLLSGCLCIVPTTDPLSLTLPEDSFQTLSRTLGLPDLKPWDEKWPADRDGIQLLREFLTFSGKPRAERCWADEDECMSSSHPNILYLTVLQLTTTVGFIARCPPFSPHVQFVKLPNWAQVLLLNRFPHHRTTC